MNVLRTPTDAGPPKMRRVGNRANILSVGFEMTSAQVSTLETFVKTTVAGVKRFNFTHPRTGLSKEVRLVPSQSGDYFSTSYLAPEFWRVDLELEVLP